MSEFGLSIVIPCRNEQDSIGRQLEALSAQEWDGSWEVIISDNGSTDDTVARAQEWAGRVPSLKIVDSSALPGISFARNRGADAARFSTLVWIDADDRVPPGWLEAIGTAARDAVFFTGGSTVDTADHARATAGRTTPSRWARLVPEPGFLDAAPGHNLGVRKQIWKDVGGFDESMLFAEDTAFSWSVQLAGHALTMVPGAEVSVDARHGLRELARQQYNWGHGAVKLYLTFRDRGAPRSPVAGALLRWLVLVVTAPIAMTTEERRRNWVGRVSRRAGKLAGSIRYRVVQL